MPVAVRLLEFSATLTLFLLVASATFLLYCAGHILTAAFLIAEPLFYVFLNIITSFQCLFQWSTDKLFVIVNYLSGIDTTDMEEAST